MLEFDFSLVSDSFPLLVKGALVTIEITALSVSFGLVIGLLAALAAMSNFAPLRWLSKVYVDFIRGTPLLVQIFIIYFALPAAIGHRVDPFFAAVVACSINSGAYIAEIFRAGIASIAKGQMQAALSLGMNWKMAMRYVILPQAFQRILPPLGNEFIAMLKDSSLVSVIGFEELTRSGQLIIAQTYGTFEIWTCVALLYLAMTLTISQFVGWLERRTKVEQR
ncbi:MAG: amino acid ABC transporter permease [Duodenibacillus sp.]|nr:amino acid ABC transporter permease [Duodenibacillus sp.]